MSTDTSTLTTAFIGRQCRAERRDADWSFDFGNGLAIAASSPWRIVTADGIAHGSEDDGQRFGLSERLDGELRTNELLSGRAVVGVKLDDQTADLQITFDGGTRLDLFNASAGYEGWQASLPSEGQGITVVAKGGGGVTIQRD